VTLINIFELAGGGFCILFVSRTRSAAAVAGNGDDDQADIRGRNRIIMIRRELPLTTNASPAELSQTDAEDFSFVACSAAAETLSRIGMTLFMG